MHRWRESDRLSRSRLARVAKPLRNKDGKRFTRVAFVLGFATLASARDVVRGFCATFATKSGKELCATLLRIKTRAVGIYRSWERQEEQERQEKQGEQER